MASDRLLTDLRHVNRALMVALDESVQESRAMRAELRDQRTVLHEVRNSIAGMRDDIHANMRARPRLLDELRGRGPAGPSG